MTAQWLTVLLLPALSLAGWAQSPPQTRFPITPRQVARALSNYGVETADEQVSLPASVVSAEAYPALDVLTVEPLGDITTQGRVVSRSSVKLTCHTPGTCLPFYAMVNGPVVMAPIAAPQKTSLAVTMRAGTHAILVMDDQRAHIQVAVVTLESGATGKWIRVASPDHKQTYWGEVVSANQLRGSF